MHLLTNDRFYIEGDKPKCLVVTGGDIEFRNYVFPRISISIIDEYHERIRNVEPDRSLTSNMLHGFSSVILYNLPNLRPGEYIIQLHYDGMLMDARSILVMSKDDWNFTISKLSNERIKDEMTYDSDELLLGTFYTAWLNISHYYDCPLDHIVYNFVGETKFSRFNILPPIQAIEWCLFHINRFIFNQVFEGGFVEMRAGEDRDGIYCKYMIRSHLSSFSESIPGWLLKLLYSLELDGVTVQLNWDVSNTSANLVVRMRRGAVLAKDHLSVKLA